MSMAGWAPGAMNCALRSGAEDGNVCPHGGAGFIRPGNARATAGDGAGGMHPALRAGFVQLIHGLTSGFDQGHACLGGDRITGL